MYQIITSSVHLQHHWIDASEMCTIMQASANTNRYLGSPPKGWLVNGTYEKKKEQTQEIFTAFSDFSEKISGVSPDDDDFFAVVDNFSDNISSILNKNVKVSYLEQGSLGKVFKIELDGKKYILKTLRNLVLQETVMKEVRSNKGQYMFKTTNKKVYIPNFTLESFQKLFVWFVPLYLFL